MAGILEAAPIFVFERLLSGHGTYFVDMGTYRSILSRMRISAMLADIYEAMTDLNMSSQLKCVTHRSVDNLYRNSTFTRRTPPLCRLRV